MRGQLKLEWVPGIENIPKEEWDALAVPLSTPLLEWEWLRQFEASGSMVPEKGWLPYHLTLRSDNGLIAAAPLYVKGHSEGEFVWDYMWADVAHQLKVDYYPKLIGMSPATPAVGYRFLVAEGEDEDQLTDVLLYGIDQFCEQNNMSGSSFHFADPEWKSKIIERGYSAWLHQSYEWVNQGFDSFDDYLAGFNKNQRRNIKRERAQVREQGIEVLPFTGEDIPEHFFPILFDYYEKTNDQYGPWAAKYLNREFFDGLYPDFRNRLLIMAAIQEGDISYPLGMSFLLAKGDRIIGRYWGAARWIDSLHFEACYYGPIEWAINNGVKYFDPGAGSSHKLRRGFFSIGNHSLHKFKDPTLRAVMQQHIDEINQMEAQRIESMNATLPLKADYLPPKITV